MAKTKTWKIENMVEKRRWKKREDNLIRKHYKYNYEHLLGVLNCRTPAAIMIRANKLGVTKREWNEEEDNYIRRYYPEYGAVHCMKFIKARTVIAIQSRAKKLGVKFNMNKRKNNGPDCEVSDEVKVLLFNKPWGNYD